MSNMFEVLQEREDLAEPDTVVLPKDDIPTEHSEEKSDEKSEENVVKLPPLLIVSARPGLFRSIISHFSSRESSHSCSVRQHYDGYFYTYTIDGTNYLMQLVDVECTVAPVRIRRILIVLPNSQRTSDDNAIIKRYSRLADSTIYLCTANTFNPRRNIEGSHSLPASVIWCGALLRNDGTDVLGNILCGLNASDYSTITTANYRENMKDAILF